MRRELERPVQREVFDLMVNGEEFHLLLPVHKTLLEVLREDLGLTGTKHGCELGECGTCAVLIDGRPQLSCVLLPAQAVGAEITTVEGLARGGTVDPLQQAFVELGAAQCGYCTPAMLVTARALLDSNPNPSVQEIKDGLSGNLCRCTGYWKIIEAVQLASRSGARDAGSHDAEAEEWAARGGAHPPDA